MRPIAILGTFAILAMGTAMSATFPQARPQALHPDDALYQPLLETATAPLRQLFGEHVVVEVERLDCLGRWAFLQGNMRTPGGQRPDFRGTDYADRAAAGSMSDVYVALLRHDPAPAGAGADAAAVPEAAVDADSGDATAGCATGPGEWVILDHAIGPGDVSWLTWPQEHAAPRAVFGF
ncbi:hypothetical protein LY625_00365 [Lysobacter sp. GX 14042]|uniref:hypothetical protein n=1 Tax=Lysobacter sp. GX 14042 TaxID=2907155 RepID=UPI001F29D44A|nr:hypothetical protein [Lysobacter sp. GX 14042]MCE7031095.1 hypothetical protein [Lysobacter sp. GX 14042]